MYIFTAAQAKSQRSRLIEIVETGEEIAIAKRAAQYCGWSQVRQFGNNCQSSRH